MHETLLTMLPSETEPLLASMNSERADIEPRTALVDMAGQLRAAREATLATVPALTSGQWPKPAIHATTGRTTLRSQLQIPVEHDIDPTNQLAELLQVRRKAARRAAGQKENRAV